MSTEDHPDLTIDTRELFSTEIPERLHAGDLDIGLALSPPTPDGVAGELVRAERVSAILGTRHRLAAAAVIPVADLRDETLLLFPRRLAPAYYDGIVAACHQAGFAPRLRTFEEPPGERHALAHDRSVTRHRRRHRHHPPIRQTPRVAVNTSHGKAPFARWSTAAMSMRA